MAKIIDGKQISQEIKEELKSKVEEFKNKYNRQITLAVILVGENPASQVYVKNKIKATEYVGMKSLAYYLPETATEQEVSNAEEVEVIEETQEEVKAIETEENKEEKENDAE